MQVRYDLVQCHVVRRPQGASAQFLQLRRAPGEFLAGAWALVSGTIQSGETAVAAARRELREETALEPLEFYQLDHVNVFYLAGTDTIWHCPQFCAIVAADAPVRLNAEHDQYRWVDRDEANQALLWPGERTAFAELCREILDGGPAREYLRIAD
jgi:dATP pyrophosphohydrolase